MEEKKSVAHFIAYHNAIPIALGFIFLSMTATFAASEEMRESVYNEERVVRSVDTSYIIAADIEDYDFRMRVTQVVEDDEYYYLTYEFDTIDIADYVWREVTLIKELRIAKALLGAGDLETYAESELAQVRAAERIRLLETQSIERTLGERQKIVATVYSGLIGRLIEPKEEQVPQYTALVPEDDPLAVEDPVPLVTWDADAEPEEVEVAEEEEEDSEASVPQEEAPSEEGVPEVPVEEAPVEEVPPVEEESVEESPFPEEQTEEEVVPQEEVPVTE